MKNFLFMILSLTLIISGCSKQIANNSNDFNDYNKAIVSRQITTDKNWNVIFNLYWNLNSVSCEVRAKYKGNKPLDYVITEPNFINNKWPEGYYPPDSGINTWKAEKPLGAIPNISDTSSRAYNNLSKQASKEMTYKEASDILNHSKVVITWKVTNGGEFKTTIK